MRRFAISATGSFSGKRVVEGFGHGGDVTYTIKLSGRFTAPTKALGIYSLSFIYASGSGEEHCHTGTQTWKANHVGSSN